MYYWDEVFSTRAVQTDEALDLTPALRGTPPSHAALLDYALMPLIGLKESGEKPIHGCVGPLSRPWAATGSRRSPRP